MRRFGRPCRGQSKVFVSVVRQTETRLLTTGRAVVKLARAAQAQGQSATQLTEEQRVRLATQLTVALDAQAQITTQSRCLTQGKSLKQCKIVNAYDPAFALPVGNPSDASYVVPLVDKVQHALGRVASPPPLAIHSLAGDLALNDPQVRETLHARGMLTVGIPRTVDPLPPVPSPADVQRLLKEAGLAHTRTPAQVRLACACGYSRPVSESILASLLCRGAARISYKGHRGAILHTGMAVMAHNAATVGRIHQDHLSKRAQKFRCLLRLKRHKPNEFKAAKN